MEDQKNTSKERAANLQVNSPVQPAAPANSRLQPDAPTINESRAHVATNNLSQGVGGAERNPEYGDAADPASEKLDTGSRDDASPLTT